MLQDDYRIYQYRISDLTTFAGGITEAAAMWVEVEHYKIVGECLAAARRRANDTQHELAARLGKPQSFVSEYEHGQRRVDVVELLVISRGLKVDALDLFAEIAKTVGACRAAAPPPTL